MRTRGIAMNRRSLSTAITLIFLGLVMAAGSRAAEEGVGYPEDVESLVSGPLPVGNYVSRTNALSVAEPLHDFIPEGANVEAFLVQATEAGTVKSRNPILERPVWLIRYSGFTMDGSAPMRADGTPAETTPYTLAYVYLDAVTGEWLGTRLEGKSEPVAAD